ncbi:MAG: monovalent cation:proton antiporter-2 (CPA2) family protein [Pseudomonadota bacterium]
MTETQAPTLLLQGIIYLGAAVLAVPISKRIGLGSVLGYLIAGILIGPWGLRLIDDVETVLHFSELGVVMMLFLIGLELNLEKLWQLRLPIFGMGGLQVLGSVLVVLLLGLVFKLDWHIALVAGIGVAMSSTAIAMQTMIERGEVNQPAGQAAFSVLLFQDLAVIPLMLVLSLLVPQVGHSNIDWIAALKALGLVVSIVAGGNYLLRPVLRYIANTGLREVFIAFALFLIMGVALLMQSVGLSMALGAFLAGVLLADSEYRQELELDIEPFKGLLLGLFFIAVGMSVDIGLIWQQPLLIIGLALGLVIIKIALLYPLALIFKQSKSDALFFALVLSQIGEFAFVIFSTAAQLGVIDSQTTSTLNAVVAISMLTTPLLMLCYSQWIKHSFRFSETTDHDDFEVERPVIVAGFGRVGQVITRLLNGIGLPPTVIEHDPNQIELSRRFGFKAYYGNIARPDVLKAAGIQNARLLILAIDDHEDALKTARYVRTHFPHVKILARTRNRTTAFDFMDLDIEAVRETFFSSLALGELTLKELGYDAKNAANLVAKFQKLDEHRLKESQPFRHDMKKMIAQSYQSRKDLANILMQEMHGNLNVIVDNDATE